MADMSQCLKRTNKRYLADQEAPAAGAADKRDTSDAEQVLDSAQQRSTSNTHIQSQAKERGGPRKSAIPAAAVAQPSANGGRQEQGDRQPPKDRAWDEDDRRGPVEARRQRTKPSAAQQPQPQQAAYFGGHVVGGVWRPNQTQPFQQSSSLDNIQQQWRRHAEQQQQQSGGQQQHPHRGDRSSTPLLQRPDFNRIIPILLQEIEFQQAALEGVPRGSPAYTQRRSRISSMVQQLTHALQCQEQQQQQQLSQQQGTASHRMMGAATAAAAEIISLIGLDRMNTFMEPGLSDDVNALREAVGSRQLAPSHGHASYAEAPILRYCLYVLEEKIEAAMHRAVQRAVQRAAASGGGAAADVAGGGMASGGAHAANGSRLPSAHLTTEGATTAPVSREVPLMKDQKSLPDMILWYTQERDIAVEQNDGQAKKYTRSEMRDMGRSWSSREGCKRAAEYDVIYDRLKAVAVQLTKVTNQPKTIADAVQHVVQTDKVCVDGGMTMYKYMEQCRVWRKGQKEAAAAAAAMADTATVPTAATVKDGQAGDVGE